MSQETETMKRISESFNSISWHDSQLVSLQLLSDEEDWTYDLRLEVNLLTNARPGQQEWTRRKLVFKRCRILQADLDLLGLQLVGGDIADAVCETDALARESSERGQLQNFDLPQESNPADELLYFSILLIQPAGEIKIFAKDFELS